MSLLQYTAAIYSYNDGSYNEIALKIRNSSKNKKMRFEIGFLSPDSKRISYLKIFICSEKFFVSPTI
jgi:hypothetical protein